MREAGCGMRDAKKKGIVRRALMSRVSVVARIQMRMGRPNVGKSYSDLRVWNTAISLALEVYRITEAFPSAERFGLTAQLRRAAVSVPSNIAEGHARSTRGEYKNCLSVARGSVAEVEVQLTLARALGYVQSPVLAKPLDYCDAISRMITNLKHAL